MKRFLFGPKLVPALLLALLCGCKAPDKGYDLYVYTMGDQNTRQFEAACRDYTSKTGVRIKIGFPGSGSGTNSPRDYIQALRAELNSKNKPVIFYVKDSAELETWREEGFAQDFSHAGDGAFEAMVSGMAPPLRLGAEGSASYGIPLAVGAYGYITDRRMLAALFGQGNEEAVIAAIKTASYDEWANLVRTIDRWISYPYPYRLFLSGRIVQFVSVRTEETANLNGVFALAKEEGRIHGEHLLNAALNAAFGNSAGITDAAGVAAAMSEEAIRSAQPAFAGYARALDLENFFPAGRDERILKGVHPPPTGNYAEALRIFSEGRAVFLGDGSRAYGGISALNAGLSARLELLPAKVPVRGVAVGGVPAEKINRSIAVFAPGYHAVNALVSAEEKKLAYEFLLWLSTPAQGYVADNPDFVPYYAQSALAESGTIPHSFRDSITAYMKTGDLITAFDLPRLTAAIDRKLDEDYMPRRFWTAISTQFWTEADYEALAAYAVNEWISGSE